MMDIRNLPYQLAQSQGVAAPVMISSPHSGSDYPASFLAASRLDAHDIRQSEDMFVGEIFATAPAQGATLLAAQYPRAYVDLNRAPYELEPALFADRLPKHINTQSMRASVGLGTVPRLVAENTPIYDRKLSFAEAEYRIDRIYHPFHEKLTRALDDLRAQFGFAILLDAHSMPSQAGKLTSKAQVDFVLGNRHGCACDPALTDWVKNFLTGCGWRVTLNKPYAGGYITEQYGRPARGYHALQIEINRAIYMNELAYKKHSGFADLQANMQTMIAKLITALPDLQTALTAPENNRSAAE